MPNIWSNGKNNHSSTSKKTGFWKCFLASVLQTGCILSMLFVLSKSVTFAHFEKVTISANYDIRNLKCIVYSLPTHFFSDKEEEIFISCFVQLPSAFSSLNIRVIKIFFIHFKYLASRS